jgi:two-component system, OmpR family, response regulator
MRLLVVEDDAKLAAALHERLAKAKHVADIAADGHEALAFTSTTTYDTIILDIMLPGVDGLSVCRSLRASGATTPILLLTT